VRRNCCRRRSATCDLSVEGAAWYCETNSIYLTGRGPCHQRGCSDSGTSAARIPAAAARLRRNSVRRNCCRRRSAMRFKRGGGAWYSETNSIYLTGPSLGSSGHARFCYGRGCGGGREPTSFNSSETKLLPPA
jgi:hypothetical protein